MSDRIPQSRKLGGLELGGIAEIARELGVQRNKVSMWEMRSATSDFPAPVAVFAMGPVYDMDAVRHWYRTRYRRPKSARGIS